MIRLLFALALVLLLAGCGEKEEAVTGGAAEREPFTLILDYFPNADHAGIYAAQASGEFERAGLDVKIVTPPDPAAPLKLLQAGKADLAISYEPELLLARAKGAQLVSVAALVQKPLTSVIAIEGSGIKTVDDLNGRKVGTAGIPYQAAYLRTILERAEIEPTSVDRVDVGFNLVPAMISKRVDATLGAFWNYEGTDLAQRGRKPTILRMENLGVPTYAELVLVARRKDLDSQHAARLRRFLHALARGHAQLRDDPATAVDALLEANGDLERKLQQAVVEKTLPVFFPEDKDLPWGYQDPEAWRMYGLWMVDNDLVEQDPLADNAVTNEFLPGQGLEQPATEY